jgi:hypothetical protein
VLEIEDQGLGIEPGRIDELNAMLADPPDFGIMALSAEPRLGLFVVARLAARHGIAVSLRDSAYGGTRAVVLIRAEVLHEVPDPNQPAPAAPDSNAPAGPTSMVHLPIPILPDLPPLPMVASRPGEDLFRPQRPVDGPANGNHAGTNGSGAHAMPDPPTVTMPVPPRWPVAPLEPDRPPLPQRRRQQSLAPQLRREAADEAEQTSSLEVTPDRARSRLSAFQRGTARGRAAESDENGERA